MGMIADEPRRDAGPGRAAGGSLLNWSQIFDEAGIYPVDISRADEEHKLLVRRDVWAEAPLNRVYLLSDIDGRRPRSVVVSVADIEYE